MEIKITESGHRLDKALADLTPLSRSQANDQIKQKRVLVNGLPKKAKYIVQVGDCISYHIPEESSLDYQAQDIPLDIVYQDDVLAIINKPQEWLFTLLRGILQDAGQCLALSYQRPVFY